MESLHVSERATLAVARFVAGELLYDKLDMTTLRDELRPFTRRFNKLYRVWHYHDAGVSEQQLEVEAKSRAVMSTTQDPNMIPKMLDMIGADEGDHPITVFDGIGFDPYEVLRAGLESNPNMREAGFVKAVLKQYEYQSEVVVLKVIGSVQKL